MFINHVSHLLHGGVFVVVGEVIQNTKSGDLATAEKKFVLAPLPTCSHMIEPTA